MLLDPNEWNAFIKKVDTEVNIPSKLVKCPKLNEARRMIIEAVKDKKVPGSHGSENGKCTECCLIIAPQLLEKGLCPKCIRIKNVRPENSSNSTE